MTQFFHSEANVWSKSSQKPSNTNHPPKDSVIFGLQQLSICLWITNLYRRDWRWSSRTLLHPHCFQNISYLARARHNQCPLRCHQAASFEVTVAHAWIHYLRELQLDLIFQLFLEPHDTFRRSRAVELILVKLNQYVEDLMPQETWKCLTANENSSGTSLRSQNDRTLGDHPDVHTLSERT